ncbi:transporter [Ruminococcaceae bacterium OttesenSCG-928-A16]|nr:transporter [Ruminococcaceae bacterium OttesenSCG-928-A16]
MDAFSSVLFAAAVGATVGIFLGALRWWLKNKKQATQTPAPGQKQSRFGQAFMGMLTRSAFVVLGIALVWTVYFMVLGIANPAQNEFAANASSLIVSVSTIFSILIAFYEFVYRKNK